MEEIYEYVKNKLPRISKKTVYSNLQFLNEENLVQEIKIGGIKRYEPKLPPHHHMICRRCGKIKDMKSEYLFSCAMKVGKTIRDFEVEFSQVHFHGICKKCKRGK